MVVTLFSFRDLWCHPEDDEGKIQEDLRLSLYKLSTLTLRRSLNHFTLSLQLLPEGSNFRNKMLKCVDKIQPINVMGKQLSSEVFWSEL